MREIPMFPPGPGRGGRGGERTPGRKGREAEHKDEDFPKRKRDTEGEQKTRAERTVAPGTAPGTAPDAEEQ
jgi:hypothetical protein